MRNVAKMHRFACGRLMCWDVLSVLQCVAVFGSAMQCVTVCRSVFVVWDVWKGESAHH